MVFPRMIGWGAALVFYAVLSPAQDSSGIRIVPNGRSAMEYGQVVSGYDKSVGNIEHVTIDRVYLGTGLNAHLGAQTNFTGGIEVKAFNEFPRQVINGYTRRYYYYFYLTQAELTHRLLDDQGITVDIGGGYFPYKYNTNARNLGEYLFRSTTYPQTLTTEFDFPLARLAGVYIRSACSRGIGTINLDMLSTINTEWMAIGDLNVSMIASYNAARMFEIGAGIQFGSLISADESATTPHNDATKYWNGTDTSGYYTFRGIKAMGRFSVDPKRMFPRSMIFSDQDLVFYGEAALLGVKNYDIAVNSPIWYNSPLERIPVTLGVNWPTHQLLSYCFIPEAMGYYLESVQEKKAATAGICGATGVLLGVGSWLLDKRLNINSRLDILAVEAEWWGNRYPNSMQGIVQDGLPLPYLQGTKTVDSMPYKEDNKKWSVFGSKTIANRYRVSFMAASDHMRTFAWDWNRQDWEEALRGPKKWYYMLKFGVLF